jgi:hypothetical protein
MKRLSKDTNFKKKCNDIESSLKKLELDISDFENYIDEFEKSLNSIPSNFKDKLSKDVDLLKEDPKSKEIEQDLKMLSKFVDIDDTDIPLNKIKDRVNKLDVKFISLVKESEKNNIDLDQYATSTKQALEKTEFKLKGIEKKLSELKNNPNYASKIQVIKNAKTLSQMAKIHKNFLTINTSCIDVEFKSTTFTPQRKLRELIKDDIEKLEFNFDNFGLKENNKLK